MLSLALAAGHRRPLLAVSIYDLLGPLDVGGVGHFVEEIWLLIVFDLGEFYSLAWALPYLGDGRW